jgi:hypothetical protein
MSELNPDFRDDSDLPDLGDLRAVNDYLEDATVDNTERATRADKIDRLESERSGGYRDEIRVAVSKARGEGAPAETHDDSRSESKGPRAQESRSSRKG